MAIIDQAGQSYLAAYDGFDVQQVGLGTIDPNIYATKKYQKKKIANMAIGLISSVRYAGWDNDSEPMVLVMAFEPRYNTVIGLNLRYANPKIRHAIVKYVLVSNMARIKSNQPIMINFNGLKRAVGQDVEFLVRRYKTVGLSVKETYQLTEWEALAKKPTPMDGFYAKEKRARSGRKKRR